MNMPAFESHFDLSPLDSPVSDPLVTVVVPIFNEQARIADSLYKIKDYLSEQSYRADLLVIDDGSHDLSIEIVKVVDIYGAEMKDQSNGTLLENTRNVGKGYSIARGLLVAQGEYIVFTDADLSTPIEALQSVLRKFDDGYDIVIGSRNLEASEITNRPLSRKITSKAFNFIARMLGLTQVSDSQCGFKAYKREAARAIAGRQKIVGFGFDVEHLHIARKLGYRIAEVPVRWCHDENSKLSLLRDSTKMFVDLIRIRWLHRNLS